MPGTKRIVVISALIAVCFALTAPIAAAQMEPTSAHCVVGDGIFTTPSGDGNSSRQAGAMVMALANFDAKKRSAEIVGNAGAESVVMLRGQNSFTFIEETGSGNVNVTSIYFGSFRDGKHFAVHFRHVGTAARPMWSQVYGRCEVRE